MTDECLSLYIHIPFCVRKCYYCDFLSAPASLEETDNYINALLKEIESYKNTELAQRPIRSVYIGGGTPSLLKEKQMDVLLQKVNSVFNFHKHEYDRNCEISMEMNPGTVTKDKCKAYKDMGINRVSIGLQSIYDNELKLLGRIHTFHQFEQTYEWVRLAGIKNVNIDLMSALPGQTVKGYENELIEILKLNPEHISSYSLIIEEGTPFYEKYNNKCDLLPDEDDERRMYEMTKQYFAEKGYHRYEISNYAKEGFECIHNTVYWTRKDYLGLGLGSSSLIGDYRFKNQDDMKLYLAGQGHIEKQMLSQKDKMEEFMFLGLRMCSGIGVQEFKRQFGCDINEVYGQVIQKFQNMKMMDITKDKDTKEERLFLTDHGIDVSNQIFEEFLL